MQDAGYRMLVKDPEFSGDAGDEGEV